MKVPSAYVPPVMGRRSIRVALAGAIFCSLAAPAQAATIDVKCPGMPLTVEEELGGRANRLLSDAGMPWATLGIECTPSGAWLVWVDGSRAYIDQSQGIVQGALDLMQSRLAQDRYAADHPSFAPPPEVANSTTDETTPVSGDLKAAPAEGATSKTGTEGGVGLSTVTQFWSGTSSAGIGPRLDVSVGPPGKVSFLIGENALFGMGAGGSGIVMFDFQLGMAYGAPFKTRSGLGMVVLLGAERISSSQDNASSGLYSWSGTGDLGGRASVPWSSVNVWLGADLLLRSNDFQTGGPSPVSIPATSFVLSLGCFFPAFAH